MNRTERVLAFISIAGLVLLFALAMLISYQVQTADYYSDQAERSRNILIAVQNLNRGIGKAESAQRGYLLTSKSGYLDSYLQGVAATRAALIEIADRVGDDPNAQKQLSKLRTLIQAKLDELSRTVELERANRHQEAISVVQTDLGKDLMDQIQQIGGEMLTGERKRLGEHSTAIQARHLFAGRLFRAGLVGIAVLFATTVLLIQRSFKLQRGAIQALQLNQAKLAVKEHMLRTITDSLPVLISYIDSDEVIRFSNQTYKKWLDRDPSEVLGRKLVDVLGSDLYSSRREKIQSVLAGNLTEFQAVVDLQDGPHYHQITYLPDAASDGRVAGFFALTTDITAMKKIEAQLEELARCDALTGLPNRRLFEEELARFLLQREQGPFAVMFMDIDNFKGINDGYGHATGDAALKHLGNCLKTSVRASDTVARFAGDEFVALLPGLHKRDDAESIAQKILNSVRPGFTLDGRSFKFSTSIGIAYSRETAVTSEEIFAIADEALYAAKRAGRDAYRVFECNVIEMAQRPSRRRIRPANQRGDDTISQDRGGGI